MTVTQKLLYLHIITKHIENDTHNTSINNKPNAK